jgi:NADH dehydrogenase [ubiquinone] 1 alpha subcomplex assembly factor 7
VTTTAEPGGALVARLVARIRREGPIGFAPFMESALYDPEAGFFATGGGAGRAGADFVTSPEVGSLFGAVVARALDELWSELGAPDPFIVTEAGAGRGRLARDILRADPRCAPALRYVLVERSAALRDEQRGVLELEPVEDVLGPVMALEVGESPEPVRGLGPMFAALDELPGVAIDGVILANELLDNLPFDIVQRTRRGWDEVRVGASGASELTEVLVPAAADLVAALGPIDRAIPAGTRLPVQRAAHEWLAAAAQRLRRGFLVLIDYCASTEELVERDGGWLRTYRGHQRGSEPLQAPGEQDITADVAIGPLLHAADRAGLHLVDLQLQSDWLAAHGLDDLVAEGSAIWRERAHLGDLAALAGRSRATEAGALTDRHGLGAHRVLVFRR